MGELKPDHYPYVQAYGLLMGSTTWYIEAQVRAAQHTGQPQDVLYETRGDDLSATGVWVRAGELQSPVLRQMVQEAVTALCGRPVSIPVASVVRCGQMAWRAGLHLVCDRPLSAGRCPGEDTHVAPVVDPLRQQPGEGRLVRQAV